LAGKSRPSKKATFVIFVQLFILFAEEEAFLKTSTTAVTTTTVTTTAIATTTPPWALFITNTEDAATDVS